MRLEHFSIKAKHLVDDVFIYLDELNAFIFADCVDFDDDHVIVHHEPTANPDTWKSWVFHKNEKLIVVGKYNVSSEDLGPKIVKKIRNTPTKNQRNNTVKIEYKKIHAMDFGRFLHKECWTDMFQDTKGDGRTWAKWDDEDENRFTLDEIYKDYKSTLVNNNCEVSDY